MSKEIIVKNQEELDLLPVTFSEFTIIRIKSTERIIVSKARENAYVEARENTHIVVRGNASVEARDNASVEARDNASVEAWENAHVVAWENTHIEARDNASVVAWDNAHVLARDNASVEARENASVEARDNASVVARDNASVEARDNASVEAWDNAHVLARDNASVEARDNASVEAYEFSIVIVFACLSLKLYQMSSAFLRGLNKKDIKTFFKSKTSNLILQPKNYEHNLKSYLEINKPDKEGNVILYKSVNPQNNKDFYTNTIEYKIGKTIICPDWVDNNNIECGNGFHLCKNPLETQIFNKGKILKCKVHKNDINVYKYNILKVRCKKVKVICEIDINGEEKK